MNGAQGVNDKINTPTQDKGGAGPLTGADSKNIREAEALAHTVEELASNLKQDAAQAEKLSQKIDRHLDSLRDQQEHRPSPPTAS